MDPKGKSRELAANEDPEVCPEEAGRHGPADALPPDLEYTETAATGGPADDSGDGMAEYAAGYSEDPDPGAKAPLQPVTEGGEMTGPQAPDSVGLKRRELKEPDGASGPSSPLVTLPRDPPSETQPLVKPSEKGPVGKDTKPSTSKQKVGASIEVVTPADQSIERNDKSSKKDKSPSENIPFIPNTNIAVACLVTFCFNLPLGAIAIYFSLMSAKAYRDKQPKKGAKRARISIYISLTSIVLTVLLVMVVVLLLAMEGQLRQRRYAAANSRINL